MSDIESLIEGYDKILDNAIVIHAAVQMDTPDDITLHNRAVGELRMAQAVLRVTRASLRSDEAQP